MTDDPGDPTEASTIDGGEDSASLDGDGETRTTDAVDPAGGNSVTRVPDASAPDRASIEKTIPDALAPVRSADGATTGVGSAREQPDRERSEPATRERQRAAGRERSEPSDTASEPATWLRTTGLVARRDLLIEWRSRVALNQVIPFAGMVLVMFGFAIDDTGLMQRIAPGLIVLAAVFSLLILVQRAFAVETEDGALDALRTAGVPASAMFWGKTIALAVQVALLGAVLLGLSILLYGSEVRPSGVVLLVTTWLAATVGLAAVGTLYGGLAAGARGRETLLPLLLLPVVAPVLIGANRAVEAALGVGTTRVSDGWPWMGLIVVFAVTFGAGGTVAFGPLIDE